MPCIPTSEELRAEREFELESRLAFASKVISGFIWLAVIQFLALVYCAWF